MASGRHLSDITLEQQDTRPFEDLLRGDRVHRIYLNQLGEIQELPLGSALMVLTTLAEDQEAEAARRLIDRAQQSELSAQSRRDIMEMITTILVYKFETLSRREIEQMLGTLLQQTRVYQEAREEERRSLVLLLLNQKLGALSEPTIAQVSALNPEQLEALAIALLNFTAMSDLTAWIEHQS